MVNKRTKQIVVIAGPNGAGKTTSAKHLIPEFLSIDQFINADEIARGLSPFSPKSVQLEAGKLMKKRMYHLLEQNENFAFETTLSGTTHQTFLVRAKKQGYELRLLYLWVPSPDLSIERIASRVQQGGHDIEDYIVMRRYQRGLTNLFKIYLPMMHQTTLFDAGLFPPKKVAHFLNETLQTTYDSITLKKIKEGIK